MVNMAEFYWVVFIYSNGNTPGNSECNKFSFGYNIRYYSNCLVDSSLCHRYHCGDTKEGQVNFGFHLYSVKPYYCGVFTQSQIWTGLSVSKYEEEFR